jgi:hypothetical protein
MIRMTEGMRQLLKAAEGEINELIARADAHPLTLGGTPLDAIRFRDAEIVVDALIPDDPEFPAATELFKETIRQGIGAAIAKGGFRQLQRVHAMREAVDRLDGHDDLYWLNTADFYFEDDGGSS